MTPETLQDIAATIAEATGSDFTATSCEPVSGGDINRCFIIGDSRSKFFIKTNNRRHQSMLDAENDALEVLQRADALTIPAPVAGGATGDCCFLALNYLPMRSQGDGAALARGLVKLHQHSSPDGRFGWPSDNFIGTSPQQNAWHRDWHTFWLQQRLRPQLEMAYTAGHNSHLEPLAAKLEERLPDLWGDYQPQPSLLHGDLWGGNAAFLITGEPVIYDPASYYGDREADLAMTELFGGFSHDFYREYQRFWPLEPGYERRKTLYNLYHLLNHLNLFGSGYLNQCRAAMEKLMS